MFKVRRNKNQLRSSQFDDHKYSSTEKGGTAVSRFPKGETMASRNVAVTGLGRGRGRNVP